MTMKSPYITRVRVIAWIDGERVEIPAGEALPEGMHEHDIAELKRLRSIEDLTETAKAEKDADKVAKATAAEFAKARAAVQSAAESIKVADTKTIFPPEGGDPDTSGSTGAAEGSAAADLKAPAASRRQAAAAKKTT